MDFLVMQGDCLLDTPLDEMIDTHNLNSSSVTIMLKELDLSQKSKVPLSKNEVESYDIFGLTEWKDNVRSFGESY